VYLNGARALLEQNAVFAGDVRTVLEWIDKARAEVQAMIPEEEPNEQLEQHLT
jgi:hypothetical protein